MCHPWANYKCFVTVNFSVATVLFHKLKNRGKTLINWLSIFTSKVNKTSAKHQEVGLS